MNIVLSFYFCAFVIISEDFKRERRKEGRNGGRKASSRLTRQINYQGKIQNAFFPSRCRARLLKGRKSNTARRKRFGRRRYRRRSPFPETQASNSIPFSSVDNKPPRVPARVLARSRATKCAGRACVDRGDIKRGQMLPRVVKKAERARAGIKQLKILERLLSATKGARHARYKVLFSFPLPLLFSLSGSRTPSGPQNILKAPLILPSRAPRNK